MTNSFLPLTVNGDRFGVGVRDHIELEIGFPSPNNSFYMSIWLSVFTKEVKNVQMVMQFDGQIKTVLPRMAKFMIRFAFNRNIK